MTNKRSHTPSPTLIYRLRTEGNVAAAELSGLPGVVAGGIRYLAALCVEAADAIEQAQSDTARLDWLEANHALLNFAHRPWGPHVCLDGDASVEANHFYGKTYREALDAAMKAETPIREEQ